MVMRLSVICLIMVCVAFCVPSITCSQDRSAITITGQVVETRRILSQRGSSVPGGWIWDCAVVKGRVKNEGLKDVKDVIMAVSCPRCLTELPLDGWNAVQWQSPSGPKQLPLGHPGEELGEAKIESLASHEEALFEIVAAAKLIAPALFESVISRNLTVPPHELPVTVKSFKLVQ